MPLSLLAAAAGMDKFDAEEELALFGSLLRREGSRQGRTVSLFAKSFRDFLLRDQDLCGADRAVGLAMVAGYILKNCQKAADLQGSAYLERHAVTHLLQYAPEAPEAVIACLQGWQRSGSDIALLVADALEAGPESTVTGHSRIRGALQIGGSVEEYLRGKRALPALEKLISQYEKEGDQWGAVLLEADLLLWDPTPEKMEKARELYTQLLDMAAKQYAEAPDYSTRRDLAITYDRLGDLVQATKPGEAEGWYRKELELSEQNHRESPCYQSRRALAITYERLGGLAWQKDPAEAKEWYQKALALLEENARERPGDEETREYLRTEIKRLEQTDKTKLSLKELLEKIKKDQQQ
jgi:tetratricopeptide (TPR) repeat protein